MKNICPRHFYCFLICGLFAFLLIINTSTGFSSEDLEYTPNQKEILEELNIKRPKPKCTGPDIELSQGKLCGLEVEVKHGKKVNAYLGIPFAETTAGKNRWRAPVPDSGWQGTYKATLPGPACPQNNWFDPNLLYSEDCLSINVWTPSNKSEKPRSVVIFIYGGSYIYGFNAEPTYNGAYMSANGDIIFVGINYRLGSLGFLAGVKDKKTGEELKGNFGLLDQILAMKWVKDNISKFGGNPEDITLQGQSAGAASVGIHLTVSESSKGLFNSAIMESNPIGLPYKTLKQSKSIAHKFAAKLGCDVNDLSCMRSKSATQVIAAQDIKDRMLHSVLYGISDFLIWAPVIDKDVVLRHPLIDISKNNIEMPLIIGTNKNEGLLFVEALLKKMNIAHISDFEYSLALDVLFRSDKIKNKILKKYPYNDDKNEKILSMVITDSLFTCPALFVADNSSIETWVYLFDHIPSFNVFRIVDLLKCSEAVCHGAELPFVFHTAENMGYEFTEEEIFLSRVMVNYWTNFVKAANPNGNNPEWPEYKSRESNVILVTPIDEIVSKKDLKAKCSFWNSVGYDIHKTFWDIF